MIDGLLRAAGSMSGMMTEVGDAPCYTLCAPGNFGTRTKAKSEIEATLDAAPLDLSSDVIFEEELMV